MSKFYTNVATHKGDILLRGFENGERVVKKIRYKPYLFVQSENLEECKYKTIKGKPVARVDFDSIGACRDFRKKYEDVDGYDIYGMTNWQYTYIFDNYGQNVKYDAAVVRVLWLDIETDSRGGFPNIKEADKEVNAVTLKFRGKNYTYGLREYDNKDPNTNYIQCKDELELLNRVIDRINRVDPDVVSGWNSTGFDIPYITNRVTRLLGPERARDLSPWRIIERREITMMGKEIEIITWVGIASLDYLDVYKKFRSATRESYKLDYIANFEIKSKKLDYSEYGSLYALYEQNHQLYIEYNIYDVELLEKMEEKLQLFNILFSLAYFTGCNYLDAFATVRPWDVVVHNYLINQGIVVPQFEATDYYEGIEGAYVKEPLLGKRHGWVVSYDFKSLYPSLCRQCNISPETIITTIPNITVDMLFNREIEGKKLQEKIREENASLCGTGCVFDNTVEGFIPAIMRQVYAERQMFNGKMKKAKKDLAAAQEGSDAELIAKLTSDVAYYNGQQFARKIFLNAGYGAMSNRFYRWFDPRLAESITKTGQLTVRWAERAINEYLNTVCKTTGVSYVIYCDTDSAYISLDGFVEKFITDTDPQLICDKVDAFCKKKLQPAITAACEELLKYLNHRELVLDMNRENIANGAFWTAKKRYAMNVLDSEGLRYSTPELKIQGLEAVKSSTPRAVRGLVGDAIKVILTKEETDLHDFIHTAREDFKSRGFEEISFTKNTNNIGKYASNATIYQKGCPINVRAALMYNHLLKKHNLTDVHQQIGDGDKIKFCYLNMPNPAHSSVIAAPTELPKEFALDDYIDYNLQFEKSFLAPVRAMTDAIGWHIEPIPSLDDLFVD